MSSEPFGTSTRHILLQTACLQAENWGGCHGECCSKCRRVSLMGNEILFRKTRDLVAVRSGEVYTSLLVVDELSAAVKAVETGALSFDKDQINKRARLITEMMDYGPRSEIRVFVELTSLASVIHHKSLLLPYIERRPTII